MDERRNYYRVLHLQPDAPGEVIENSYRALCKLAAIAQPLLDAALATLRVTSRRQVYDQGLSKGGHRAGLAALQTLRAPSAPAPAKPVGSAVSSCDYHPLIAHYCAFCKTPHAAEAADVDAQCVECTSPLFPPPADLLELARRAVARVPRDDPISVFLDWPSRAHPGRLVDLSPTGLKVATALALELGDVVKIDSSSFAAVGAVAHRSTEPGPASSAGTIATGIRFLAVRFKEARGTFVSRRA